MCCLQLSPSRAQTKGTRQEGRVSTDTKAEHTVPQSYLRRFTSTPHLQKHSKMMIWVFDKALGQSRQQKIKNAGFENKFYDFTR